MIVDFLGGYDYDHNWGFDMPTMSTSGMAKDLKFSKSSEKLDNCLKRKDFEPIINDQDLFWLAFCKALSLNDNEKQHQYFCTSAKNNRIEFSGKEHIIKDTQDFVEKIRIFFLDASKNYTNFKIFVPNGLFSSYLEKENSFLDLKNYSDFDEYSTNWYETYIKPSLSYLAEFCGAIYVEEKKEIPVYKFKHNPDHVEIKAVEVIRIDWLKDNHLIYPIPPKIILEPDNLIQGFYSLYQHKQCCDFTLSSKDNVKMIHSSILYLNGGPVFQKLLNTSMNETINKAISFPEFSQGTIDNFIDFIYLGGKSLSSNYQKIDDLFELFVFANTYQISTLIDCCTNLISLLATKEDLETIKNLTKIYDNAHLKQLEEHFSCKNNTFIKV